MGMSGVDYARNVSAAGWSARRAGGNLKTLMRENASAAGQRASQDLQRMARRRRCVRRLLAGEAVADAECREAALWADSALAPIARLHRLAGLAAVLAVAIFIVGWPLFAIAGAPISFADAFMSYVAMMALTAPFALLGERERAQTVVDQVSASPGPDDVQQWPMTTGLSRSS